MRVSIGSRHALRSAHNFRVSPSTLRRQTTLASSSSSGSTVNPDEIAHFSRLSAQWWDERGEFGMLHKMNPVRAQFIRDRILRVRHDEGMPTAIGLEGMEALDVGCGGGLMSEVSLCSYIYN